MSAVAYRIILFAVLVRRSQSIPARPRFQSQMQNRAPPNMAAQSWRSRRAYSCDDSRCSHSQIHTRSPNKKDVQEHDPAKGMVHSTDTSKYAKLQSIRKAGEIFSIFRQEHNKHDLDYPKAPEETSVNKLTKFLNNVIKKIFQDGESEGITRSHAQGKARANDVSMDNNSDFGAKLSALMSYFSSENREKYFKGEFLSLLAKKLFSSKDELSLHEFCQTSADCDGTGKGLKPKVDEEHASDDIIICMSEEGADAHAQYGERSERMNSVSLSVMARLVESLASSSDVDSDSSSSSDYLTSDSSATEDWDRTGTSPVTHGNKTFQHTTIDCQELAEPVCAADSQYSSSSSLFSTSSSCSSSSSPVPSPSPSSSSPAPTSQKKVKSKLYQRYYHVFRSGELVRLIQDGIPSAAVLKEYYDHGNWAVILERATSKNS